MQFIKISLCGLESKNMKKCILSLILGLGLSCYAAMAKADITFAVDAANVGLPDYKLKAMSLEQRKEYCTGFGYKLLTCADPYMPESVCRADASYVSKCICRPEYKLECLETDGLRGVGPKCDGKYAKCCNLICKNPYATLMSCEEQGLEEIHSERDYNGCGETCYVCHDKCTKGVPENLCPKGQKCIPYQGVSSQLGRRCCQCGCPTGQKECLGFCIGKDECCPACKDGFKCSGGVCVEK